MPSKRKIKRLLKEKIRNIWLLRGLSFIFCIFLLAYLYKSEIIAIAFINGQPITVSEVIKIYTSPDKENVLDKIISEKLLEYETKKRNIRIKSEEIKNEMSRMEKEAVANGITMAQLLKESDQTAKDLEKNVRMRLIIYKILSEDIDLSENEVDKYLNENPQLYENLSKEEAREGVRRLLIDAKVQDEYKTWIREAKASSVVKYIFKY